MILKVKSDWLINTLVHVVIYITGQDFLKVSLCELIIIMCFF